MQTIDISITLVKMIRLETLIPKERVKHVLPGGGVRVQMMKRETQMEFFLKVRKRT